MLLSELFEQLTYGELFQVAIGGYGTGGIDVSDFPAIIAHTNMGLKKLHSRFCLRTEEVFIEQQDFIQTYYLRSKFAISNTESSELIKYIIDSPLEPFNHDVLGIEQVYSEAGEKRPINDEGDLLSVYVQGNDTITIPYAMEGNTFSVIYRANHDKIEAVEGMDPTKIQIHLPPCLEEALMIFIAGRIVGNMGSTDNLNASTVYQNRYELALAEVESLGLLPVQDLENNRLIRNGWV